MKSKSLMTKLFLLVFPLVCTFSEVISDINQQNVNKQFQYFELTHAVPSVFVINQVFRFNGTLRAPPFVLDNIADVVTYRVTFYDITNATNKYNCFQGIDKDLLEFDLTCRIAIHGNISLEMSVRVENIFGIQVQKNRKVSFKSNLTRTVKEPLDFSKINFIQKESPKPLNFKLEFVDNKIIFLWNSKAALTKITFSQLLKTKTTIKRQFILSNFHSKYVPDFFQFWDFEATNTTVQISHAHSRDGTLNQISSPFGPENASLSFNAIRHVFQFLQEDKFKSEPSLPLKLNPGQKFKFTLTFTQRMRNEYLIMSIDGKGLKRFKPVQSLIEQQDQFIKQNFPIVIEIQIQHPGSYIISMFSVDGQAFFNKPIYIGEGFPLLPQYHDFYDFFKRFGFHTLIPTQQEYILRTLTNRRIREPDRNSSLSAKRQYLLELLNAERKKYGVPPLEQDPIINNLTQSHAEDMIKNNYISPINLQGESPQMRAKKQNITSKVREYLTGSYSLGGAHLDTQLIPGVVQILMSSVYTRVGIGIIESNLTPDPNYIVIWDFTSRDFVKYPPQPAELNDMKAKILKLILQQNPNIIKQDKNLSGIMEKWFNQSETGNIQDLRILLDEKGMPESSTKIITQQIYLADEQLNKIRQNKSLINLNGTKVGLSIGLKKETKQALVAYIVI